MGPPSAVLGGWVSSSSRGDEGSVVWMCVRCAVELEPVSGYRTEDGCPIYRTTLLAGNERNNCMH